MQGLDDRVVLQNSGLELSYFVFSSLYLVF